MGYKASGLSHLHGPSDRCTGGDTVKAEVIEHLVSLTDGHDVRDPGVGSYGS